MFKKSFLIISIVMIMILSAFVTGCVDKQNAGDAAAKTLIYGRGADSISLDPAQVTDGESLKVTRQIFDTLVQYKEHNTEVIPALAEKWEQSEDGKTWTFYLRKGVKFHDGTDFNADAVVYNFNRWMDPKHPEHKGGEFPYYAYMFGGYLGDDGHVIKAVTAVDAHTVKFELNFTSGPFLNNLAMPPFAIASPTAVKADPVEFNQNPVGTGAFKIAENGWKKNDAITLIKNDNFWQKGFPLMDKLIYKSIPDNAARFTALQAGDIDMMDGMNPDDSKTVKQNDALALHIRPGMNIAYLAFNTEKKPFDNPKVRQALNMAVNKQGIINSFYANMAEPAINPMPNVLWGYNDSVIDYEYNIEKAKQLLAEAGHPNGFEVEFYAMQDPRPYMPNGKKVAEYMQQDFAKIGVKTKIVSYDWQTYKDRVGKGEHQMALFGWIGDNGDPDNFLYVLLDKDNTRTPDAGNISFYRSEPLHSILIEAQRSTDQSARSALYEKAQDIIKKDAPWIPLVHATVPEAARSDVKGWRPHPTGSEPLYNVSISK
ncbi:ABC transporter substrate-binding protein [Hazenella sp. IB182357]|uniref:ABC transporter substrate-binding protein n=1 Tax=Polycladospora coralii TaxID=2771432 RepID=A0A926N6W4_9BACL|nr:ABC transporter substrate-binding protein [Polycladospora coralii]MBD1370851.1 ABC transporter substrate-binding protein [Polycladospora coralii]MBS7529790.1 ABC transporter substrate-binding protein [Polycladospora coralii]